MLPRRDTLGLLMLPILAAHAAYLISAMQQHVPWCWPYLDGCTSISRAARFGMANLLFKTLMLPYAGLLARFWWQLDEQREIRALGVAGAGFLGLYVLFLGWDGSLYQWLRRYGITCHFAFSVLAQMLTLRVLLRRRRLAPARRGALLLLCALLLGLGLLSLPYQHWAADADAAVNRIEWCYALLMLLFYPLAGPALPIRSRPGGRSDPP